MPDPPQSKTPGWKQWPKGVVLILGLDDFAVTLLQFLAGVVSEGKMAQQPLELLANKMDLFFYGLSREKGQTMPN